VHVRKLIFDIHLWVGLSVGLLLVLAGLTGSLLVFDEEIDAALNPGLLQVAPGGERAPLQQVVASVAAAYPEHPVSYIRMPRAPGETYEVTTAGAAPLEIFVDPYRGTVLGARGTTEGFVNTLHDLHVHLLSGETGETVMGVVGLLTLLLVVTGAVVWWPGVRRWWEGFTVRWRANWKRMNFDLHRAGGIWSAMFLAVTAATGAGLIFHDAFLAAANRITASPESPPPPAVVPRPGEAWLPLDSLLRQADRALPGGEITYVAFPAAPEAPLSVRKYFDAALHPNGRSFVYLDPWTGRTLAVERALGAPAGMRALNLLYPLHIGSFGGVAVQVVYALLGLSPLVLFVTGGLMWWNRTQAPKRRARNRRPGVEPPAALPTRAPGARGSRSPGDAAVVQSRGDALPHR
jgi:uncharacterized iron-regulated membrane protein